MLLRQGSCTHVREVHRLPEGCGISVLSSWVSRKPPQLCEDVDAATKALSGLHKSVRCTTSRSRGCRGRNHTRPRALSATSSTSTIIFVPIDYPHDYSRFPTHSGGITSTFPLCFGTCHDQPRLSLAFCFTGGCIATASRIQAFSDFIIITMGRLSSFHCHLQKASPLLGGSFCFCSGPAVSISRLRKVSVFPSLH